MKANTEVLWQLLQPLPTFWWRSLATRSAAVAIAHHVSSRMINYYTMSVVAADEDFVISDDDYREPSSDEGSEGRGRRRRGSVDSDFVADDDESGSDWESTSRKPVKPKPVCANTGNTYTTHTHTHTHLFNGPLSGTTQLSWYQKGKTNLDFTGARDSECQWHQLGHMQVCTTLQTDSHASTPPLSFLQAGCPSCHPTNSVKALKGLNTYTNVLRYLMSF